MDPTDPTQNVLLSNGAFLGWDYNRSGEVDKDLGENLLTSEDHTNPTMDDTDGDSFTDGREVTALLGGSDPTDSDSILITLTGRITTLNTTVPASSLKLMVEYQYPDPDPLNPNDNFENTDPISAIGDIGSGIYTLPELPAGIDPIDPARLTDPDWHNTEPPPYVRYIIYAWDDDNGVSPGFLDLNELSIILGHPDVHDPIGVEFSGGSHVVVLDFDLTLEKAAKSVAPTFDDWVLNEEIPIPAASPDADADGDGIANFIEYATNTDPNDSRSKPEASFHLEDTLGGLIPAENPGYRMLTVSHPWNGILAQKVSFEIQVSPDLNQGWTVLQPGDGVLDSLSISDDRIEARIRCTDVRKILFTRFVFKEAD